MSKIKEIIINNNLVAPAIVLGLFFVLFGLVIRSGITTVANKDNSITVTGSTEREVTSDTAKWTISISERAYGENAGQVASRNLTRSQEAVIAYIKRAGIAEDKISTQAGYVNPICDVGPQGYENCSVGVRGQTATKSVVVEVDGDGVQLIKNLSEKITSELSVNITSSTAEYYFSKLKDIRVEMLSEATQNAKERADAVAKAGGATVGSITSLSSGVFQVTQKNSVMVDDYGAYDTSSIDKKITATVKANFSVK